MIGLQDEMKQSDDRGDTEPLDKQMERDAITGLWRTLTMIMIRYHRRHNRPTR